MRGLKIMFWMATVIWFPALLFAHTAIINCEENDEECCCSGIFSDMSPAAGAVVTVTDDSGKVIRQGKIDADGEFCFPLPHVHYKVFMNAGPGHEAEPWDPSEE